MRRNEIAWAAGLFEGEGSLSVMKKAGGRPAIQLSLTSTDFDVTERFRSAVGCGKVYGPYLRGNGRKQQYVWRAHGWDLLQRLHVAWNGLLCARRSRRFAAVLALRPAQYVRINRTQRKLRSVQVIDVRLRLSRGETQRKIAGRHGVSQAVISKINLGDVYREVKQTLV